MRISFFRSSTLLKSTVICVPSGDVQFPKPKTKKNEKKKQPTYTKIVSEKTSQWITTQNEKRKRKEEDKYHDNKKKKEKRQQKQKCEFHGEELLGPQASLRVAPCPPAPNHTRGEVIRPPSQIKNNSYSVIRTRDLDDLSSTRCAPTITARPSGNYIINKDKLSV